MPIRPPLPRGDRAPRRFVQSEIGRIPQGACSPQAKQAAIPFEGMPPTGDMEWGRYARPIVRTGSADLTVIDVAGPPPVYQPVWETMPQEMNAFRTGVVVEVEVPLGFSAYRVRWVCGVFDVAWNDAVDFRIYAGNQDLVGKWTGGSQGEQEITYLREAREGANLCLCARISEDYSTGGTTPVTDLVVATGRLNVWLLKNADRKTGC